MCLPDSVALNQKRHSMYVYTYISPIDDDNFSTTTLLLSCLAASPPRHTSQLFLSLSLSGAFDLFPVKMMFHPLARSFFLLFIIFACGPALALFIVLSVPRFPAPRDLPPRPMARRHRRPQPAAPTASSLSSYAALRAWER